MVDLTLVPRRAPDAAEKVRTRIKALPRPSGMLQCPACGGRAACRIEAGIIIRDGKRQRGTLIDRDVCASCMQFRKLRIYMLTGGERPARVK